MWEVECPFIRNKEKAYCGFDCSEILKHIQIVFCRYLLVDSLNITAYGFIGINYDIDSSFMKREIGSFYFVIPQVTCVLFASCIALCFFP